LLKPLLGKRKGVKEGGGKRGKGLAQRQTTSATQVAMKGIERKRQGPSTSGKILLWVSHPPSRGRRGGKKPWPLSGNLSEMAGGRKKSPRSEKFRGDVPGFDRKSRGEGKGKGEELGEIHVLSEKTGTVWGDKIGGKITF